MSEAFKLISALDLSSLSETERQAATVEVRAQLDHIVQSGKHDVETLARKVSLLKIWQKLIHLRVLDVARNVAPPNERPDQVRLYPEASLSDQPTENPQSDDSSSDADSASNSNIVLVRTLAEGVVQGMRLPAGVTVETSPEDADSLVASGIGMIIQKSDMKPDEEVTKAVKTN